MPTYPWKRHKPFMPFFVSKLFNKNHTRKVYGITYTLTWTHMGGRQTSEHFRKVDSWTDGMRYNTVESIQYLADQRIDDITGVFSHGWFERSYKPNYRVKILTPQSSYDYVEMTYKHWEADLPCADFYPGFGETKNWEKLMNIKYVEQNNELP